MLATLLLVITGAIFIPAALLYLFQERLIYFPERTLIATPEDLGLAFDDLHLRTEDGLDIHGWYIPGLDPERPLLFLHGNAGNISHRLETIEIFHELGLSVLIIDYRGYGLSEGRPGEAGSYRDAEAAWNYLVEHRGISPSTIIVFGRSLGGGVAAGLAGKFEPGALILESTFTSVTALAEEIYPFLPVKWLCRIHYPNLERIKHIAAPKLLIHSEDDELVPFTHGESLYRAAKPPKTFLKLRGGHNDGFLFDRARYKAGLENFLKDRGTMENGAD